MAPHPYTTAVSIILFSIQLLTHINAKQQNTSTFPVTSNSLKNNQKNTRSIIRITSILGEPYLFENKNNENSYTTAKYEGFSKDLAESLAHQLNFLYVLDLVRDGRYGVQIQTGIWNGMIGELVGNTADIAIAPLTITRERAEVVDFSTQFMEFQLVILLKKPEGYETIQSKGNSDLGSYVFLRPFSGVLWLVFIIAIVTIPLLLCIIELYVPVKNRVVSQPSSIPTPPACFCENGIFGSPKTTTGRIFQIVFWVFVTIMVAAYIAAFTTDRIVDRLGLIQKTKLPIMSLEDLTSQSDIKYGVVRDGSTYNYFRNSKNRLNKKFYAGIRTEAELPKSTVEGFQLVRNGSYAFIAEEPQAEYETMRKPCDTVLVPGYFGPKRGFGVASRIGPDMKHLTGRINLAILQMKESGEMDKLERRWFDDRDECVDESSEADDDINEEVI